MSVLLLRSNLCSFQSAALPFHTCNLYSFSRFPSLRYDTQVTLPTQNDFYPRSWLQTHEGKKKSWSTSPELTIHWTGMIHKCKSLFSPQCNITYLFRGCSTWFLSFLFPWWEGALVCLKACPHSFILRKECLSYFFQMALHVLYQNVTACAQHALSDQLSCQSNAHS